MKASETISLFTNIYSNSNFSVSTLQKSSKQCHIPWPLTCFQSKGSIHINAKVSVKFFHPNSGFLFLFERAFQVMKNGVYFIVIALFIAELFKILIYANYMTCDVTTGKVVRNHKKLNISRNFFCIELKLSAVVTLITKFHMSTVIFPWQDNGSRPSPFKRENQSFPPLKSVICFCCLLLLFIQ